MFTIKNFNKSVAKWENRFDDAKDVRKFYFTWSKLLYKQYIVSKNMYKSYTTIEPGYSTFGIMFGFPELEALHNAAKAQFDMIALMDAYDNYLIKHPNTLTIDEEILCIANDLTDILIKSSKDFNERIKDVDYYIDAYPNDMFASAKNGIQTFNELYNILSKRAEIKGNYNMLEDIRKWIKDVIEELHYIANNEQV